MGRSGHATGGSEQSAAVWTTMDVSNQQARKEHEATRQDKRQRTGRPTEADRDKATDKETERQARNTGEAHAHRRLNATTPLQGPQRMQGENSARTSAAGAAAPVVAWWKPYEDSALHTQRERGMSTREHNEGGGEQELMDERHIQAQ